MLGLAEYVAQGADLQTLGEKYESKIRTLTQDIENKNQQYNAVKGLVPQYTAEYRDLLYNGMIEVAQTAIDHYSSELGIDIDDSLATNVVDSVFRTRYYGATLDQRLAVQARQLSRRLAQAGLVGQLDKTFTSHIAGGSQTAADRRLLLGMLSKIENEVAKQMATQGDVPFIRWTTSHRHKQPDVCDDLASNIDKSVVAYLDEHNLSEDPRGLYFKDELPNPPHPNCQCEYSLVTPGERRTQSLVKRAANKVRSLLRRIKRK